MSQTRILRLRDSDLFKVAQLSSCRSRIKSSMNTGAGPGQSCAAARVRENPEWHLVTKSFSLVPPVRRIVGGAGDLCVLDVSSPGLEHSLASFWQSCPNVHSLKGIVISAWRGGPLRQLLKAVFLFTFSSLHISVPFLLRGFVAAESCFRLGVRQSNGHTLRLQDRIRCCGF